MGTEPISNCSAAERRPAPTGLWAPNSWAAGAEMRRDVADGGSTDARSSAPRDGRPADAGKSAGPSLPSMPVLPLLGAAVPGAPLLAAVTCCTSAARPTFSLLLAKPLFSSGRGARVLVHSSRQFSRQARSWSRGRAAAASTKAAPSRTDGGFGPASRRCATPPAPRDTSPSSDSSAACGGMGGDTGGLKKCRRRRQAATDRRQRAGLLDDFGRILVSSVMSQSAPRVTRPTPTA